MAAASTSRGSSLDSEPDLIAFSTANILPTSTSLYSYAPHTASFSSVESTRAYSPEASLSASQSGVSRQSASKDGTLLSSPSNRSRARASTLGLDTPSRRSTSTRGDLPLYAGNAISYDSPMQHKTNGHARRDSLEGEEHDDDSDDELEHLEMDTLNKNSGGRGGWKMVPGHGPLTPNSPGASMSATQRSHVSLPGNGNLHAGLRKHSRFEPLSWQEWAAMSISSILVIALTAYAMNIPDRAYNKTRETPHSCGASEDKNYQADLAAGTTSPLLQVPVSAIVTYQHDGKTLRRADLGNRRARKALDLLNRAYRIDDTSFATGPAKKMVTHGQTLSIEVEIYAVFAKSS